MNIVTGNRDGQAVLLRALQPTQGLAYMMERMNSNNVTQLCAGPAKLVKALGIPATLNGQHVDDISVTLQPSPAAFKVGTSPRIGISKATDISWRFFAIDAPAVAKYRPFK